MVGPSPDERFPFGRPVLRRRPSAKSKRRVYVLGTLPSALHIAWWSPTRKLVKALAVDNEPAAFWNGADEKEQIAAWRQVVGFRVGDWGEVETSDAMNGAAGRWADENVLGPLGVTRDEVCLSTCFETYFTESAMDFAVTDRYQPWARDAGLPEAHLRARPALGEALTLIVETQRERLLHELSVTVPETVVTVGTFPLKVMRLITGDRSAAKLRPDESYGAARPLTVGRRSFRWIALASSLGTPDYAAAHARWAGALAAARP
jgi:hypothetical protein